MWVATLVLTNLQTYQSRGDTAQLLSGDGKKRVLVYMFATYILLLVFGGFLPGKEPQAGPSAGTKRKALSSLETTAPCVLFLRCSSVIRR